MRAFGIMVGVVLVAALMGPVMPAEAQANRIESVSVTPDAVDVTDGYGIVEVTVDLDAPLGRQGVHVAGSGFSGGQRLVGVFDEPGVQVNEQGSPSRVRLHLEVEQGTADGTYDFEVRLTEFSNGDITDVAEGAFVVSASGEATPPPGFSRIIATSSRPFSELTFEATTTSTAVSDASLRYRVDGEAAQTSLVHTLTTGELLGIDFSARAGDSVLVEPIDATLQLTTGRVVTLSAADLSAAGLAPTVVTVGLAGDDAARYLDDDPTTAVRVGAASPTAWAVEVSTLRFADGSVEGAVLVSADNFPDALAATSLIRDQPLLLIPSDGRIPADVATEIDRVTTPDACVTVVGGTAAVGDVTNSPRPLCDRLAGGSRVETGLAVANARLEIFRNPGPLDPPPSPLTVYVARAFGTEDNPTAAWADATAVGQVLAGRPFGSGGAVLLLTGSDQLDARVADWLRANRQDIGNIEVLGGTAAVSEAVEDELGSIRPTGRISGATRDATAADISSRAGFGGTDVVRVLVVDGYSENGWAWQLGSAGLAADTHTRLLLTAPTVVPVATRQLLCNFYLNAGVADSVVIGSSSISDEVVEDLRAITSTGCG